jgi:stage V sporulation protein G
MKITKVSVRKVENGNPKMKGTAYIEIDNCFAIENIRIIEKNDGSLFAAMPSKKRNDGEFHDICHPINEETRNMFNKAIIDEYNNIEDNKQEEKTEE